eukprot:8162230-Pyramimonas_sp.AAC.1
MSTDGREGQSRAHRGNIASPDMRGFQNSCPVRRSAVSTYPRLCLEGSLPRELKGPGSANRPGRFPWHPPR